jgi:LPPG:FO 2-phospho-L-lactate transferase
MKVALLAGGTGGAKMAHGFQQVLGPGELTVIANVADDLELHGLHVSPDVDSILYTLAGLIDTERGWGIADDTFTAHEMLGRYGEEDWFRVGDADLATHVHRTWRLRDEGASLTDVMRSMARALKVPTDILPATDHRLRTTVETAEGPMDFQRYFVARRQEPQVKAVTFDGIEAARPTPTVLDAVATAELIVVAPSNPIVSIGPIADLPGMREAMAAAAAPTVAVSPIVAGRALKGPADRMLTDLGHEATALGVARLYVGLVDHFVLDEADAALESQVAALGLAPLVLPTVMRTDADRAALARELVGRILSA